MVTRPDDAASPLVIDANPGSQMSQVCAGLSKREVFAKDALVGFISNPIYATRLEADMLSQLAPAQILEALAVMAVMQADALIKVLNSPQLCQEDPSQASAAF